MRGRIEKLQSELAATEGSRTEASDQLRKSDRSVSEARRTLFELSQRRRALEAQLAEIGQHAARVRADASRQEDLAARLLRLQYEQGAPDGLRLLLEGHNPADAARHLEYYGYIQRARIELIAHLRDQAAQLEKLESDARSRREELARNEQEQGAQAKRLEKERAQRVALVAKLSGEIARNRREIGRLRRDEARLTRLVEQIARALAAKPAPPGKGPGRRADRVADASASAQAFASLKGRMSFPVRGELANRYGGAREAGAAWKGLFIRCATGETVHAVADGRVVYADWLRGFGNLLILDHGGGYMSLYGYNEGLLRQVGDRVRAGDPIAQAGATGASAESGLYFELRRNGAPFDPMTWIAP
ncbi:MAG TPA: peptidoglycan DD-metalloendopeptidase family protein [Usitatibacter sp.]|nr:peptidoglycan DD-metalloendopeptidase family protein [Usitatibacter sp.]